MDVKSTWIPTWHRMDYFFMVTWTIFKNPPLGGRSNTKPEDYGTPNNPNRWFILFYHVWGFAWIEMAFRWGPNHIWLHTTLDGQWPHYMFWRVCWDGLWTLSFRLSQCHGHGSWLACEVALIKLWVQEFARTTKQETNKASTMCQSSTLMDGHSEAASTKYLTSVRLRSVIEWTIPSLNKYSICPTDLSPIR